MFTLAATEQLGIAGHLLGTLGAGGLSLAGTFVLRAFCKGCRFGKFRNPVEAAAGGFVVGSFYASATQVWRVPGTVTLNLAESVQHVHEAGGIGMGSIAIIVTILIARAERLGRGAILGVAAASIYGAAGGIWGLLAITFAEGINHLVTA